MLPITGSSTPGVHVGVNDSPVARPSQLETNSRLLAVGYSPWGPVNQPVNITGFEDYRRQFGGLHANSALGDAMYIFFNVFPGDRAVVVRVVGAAAAVATKTIKDRGVDEAEDDTLRIDAKYPSSSVEVRFKIEAGTEANTVRLTVWSNKLDLMESYNNLKMDAASLAIVNAASKLVKLTNLASANAAPANLPDLTAETLLVGGSDDFAGLSDASFIGAGAGTAEATGLQVLNSEEFGPGQVALPGVTTDAAHAALEAHGLAYQRLPLHDAAEGLDKDEVKDVRDAITFGGLHWPRVVMLDFAGSGVRKFYPTSAFAAGACAKADSIGVFKAPAGLTGLIPGALGIETYSTGLAQMDDNTRAFLNENQINAIVPFRGQGIRIYGERLISPDSRVQMIHEIRTLNYLYYQLKASLQNIPFQTIDGSGQLFREAKSVCESICRQLWRAGGLYGATEEEAFLVVCDQQNNPAESLDQQVLNVKVDVRISPTAERVNVSLNQQPLTVKLEA
ncbi:MAG TPA: hypothetical protein VF717_09330 [Pyrinomonadaceae bacterium]|jgi:hypothetical protein